METVDNESVCDNCEKTYNKVTKWQRFCSDSCRNQNYNKSDSAKSDVTKIAVISKSNFGIICDSIHFSTLIKVEEDKVLRYKVVTVTSQNQPGIGGPMISDSVLLNMSKDDDTEVILTFHIGGGFIEKNFPCKFLFSELQLNKKLMWKEGDTIQSTDSSRYKLTFLIK